MAMNPRLLRPTASGFNPKQISNLAMWLDGNDASSLTLVSSAVSEWKDKANNKVFAQTTANNRPTLETINGKTALAFGGSKTLSCVDPFTTYPLSMFFVQRLVAHTNFGMTYTIGSSNDFNLRQNGTSGTLQVQMTSTAAGYGLTTLSTSTAQLISIVYESTAANSVLYLDGTAMVPTSGGFSQPTLSGTHWIGTRGGGFPINGYIGEILIYSKTVSASERAKITQYLGKKWGITVA